MHPILFTIPGLDFPIRSFGVMLAVGFLVGSWLLGKLAQRYGDDPKEDPARYSRLTVWILIGVVIGARVLYVIVETGQGSATGKEFLAEPWLMFAVWKGGLVMYGGMFGAITFGLWAARREHLRIWHALDLGLIAGMVGQSIGRVGCFLVGDDFGARVPERWRDLPWPITLHVPNPLPPFSLFNESDAGQVLWATQNWMSIKALIVAFVGWQVLKHRRYAGQVTLWIFLMYALLRGTVEFFRGDSVRGLWFGGAISTSQIISLAVVSFALIMLVMLRGRRDAPLGA